MTTEAAQRTPLRTRVAEELRAVLGRRSMSRAELERRIGKAHPYLSRRLSGDIPFDLDDIERIAAVLDIQPFELLYSADGGPTLRYPHLADRVISRPQDSRPPNRPDRGSTGSPRTYRVRPPLAA